VPEEKLESSDARYGALDLPPGAASRFPGKRIPSRRRLRFLDLRPRRFAFSTRGSRSTVSSGPGWWTPDGGDCDSIVPGSAVGVELVRGDMSATAIGTARTGREPNSRIGHPFYALGRVQLPLTAATIHTVFASQQISTKVGSRPRRAARSRPTAAWESRGSWAPPLP